ncbi:MAG: DUF1538 domain-containing protein [Balneolaceae bacterium]
MQTLQETIREVIYAIVPITVLVLILQFTVIWLPAASLIQFLIGVLFVSAGLCFFLVGVHIGLLPVGEMIGSSLPRTGKMWMIILFSFILGAAVTIAEPDVHVLSEYVDQVSRGEIGKWQLILPVALGLGVFVALSMVRIIFQISIKWILFAGYSLILIVAFSSVVPNEFIPISFDAGGVTTGPMAVPFILAFGVGIASVLRGGDDETAGGFGLVALASMGPILAVLFLGIAFA